MGAPRISILIPTFNRAEMLVAAVESALAQTYPNVEILVSDNASTDGTPQAMTRFQGNPRVVSSRNHANVGMVANWRKLLLEATGDYFLLLSDDDELLEPTYLENAAALIQTMPSLTMVYANGYILDTRTGARTELRLPFKGVLPGATVFASRDRVFPQDFTLCNVLFNRAMAIEMNAFSNPHNLCCDSELFLCLCLLGPVGVLEDFASLYRVHSGNLIDTVNRDYDLLTQNLEMYFRPFDLALRRQSLNPDERRAFEEVMWRAVRRTLLGVLDWHPARYGECLAQLKTVHPEAVRRATRNLNFWRKALRIRWRRWRTVHS